MAFARALAPACILPLAARAQAKPLRVNVTSDPGMIDPVNTSELVARPLLDNVREAFTDVSADGKIEPSLRLSRELAGGRARRRLPAAAGREVPLAGRPFIARDVRYTDETLL